jgi:hypothetical protein
MAKKKQPGKDTTGAPLPKQELLDVLAAERFTSPAKDKYKGLAIHDGKIICGIRRRRLAVALGLADDDTEKKEGA